METKCLTRLECLVTALHHSKRILPAEVEFCVKEALEAINYSDSTFAQLIAAKLSIIATLFPTIVCQNLNGILNYTRHAQVLIDMLPSILSLVSREIMSETIKSLLEVAKIDSELILPVLNILSVVPIVRPLVHNVTDFINSAIISTDEQNFPCVCRLLLSSDLLKPESLETLLIEMVDFSESTLAFVADILWELLPSSTKLCENILEIVEVNRKLFFEESGIGTSLLLILVGEVPTLRTACESFALQLFLSGKFSLKRIYDVLSEEISRGVQSRVIPAIWRLCQCFIFSANSIKDVRNLSLLVGLVYEFAGQVQVDIVLRLLRITVNSPKLKPQLRGCIRFGKQLLQLELNSSSNFKRLQMGWVASTILEDISSRGQPQIGEIVLNSILHRYQDSSGRFNLSFNRLTTRLLLVVVNSTQFSPQFENAVIISIQKLLSERQEPDSVLMFIVGHISFRFVSTNVRDFDVPGEVLSSKTIGLILICRLIKRTPLLNSRDIIRLVECFQDSFARIIDSSLVAGLHLITLISEMLNDETLKVNRGEDFDDLVFRLIQARECCLNHVFKVFGFVERVNGEQLSGILWKVTALCSRSCSLLGNQKFVEFFAWANLCCYKMSRVLVYSNSPQLRSFFLELTSGPKIFDLSSNDWSFGSYFSSDSSELSSVTSISDIIESIFSISILIARVSKSSFQDMFGVTSLVYKVWYLLSSQHSLECSKMEAKRAKFEPSSELIGLDQNWQTLFRAIDSVSKHLHLSLDTEILQCCMDWILQQNDVGYIRPTLLTTNGSLAIFRLYISKLKSMSDIKNFVSSEYFCGVEIIRSREFLSDAVESTLCSLLICLPELVLAASLTSDQVDDLNVCERRLLGDTLSRQDIVEFIRSVIIFFNLALTFTDTDSVTEMIECRREFKKVLHVLTSADCKFRKHFLCCQSCVSCIYSLISFVASEIRDLDLTLACIDVLSMICKEEFHTRHALLSWQSLSLIQYPHNQSDANIVRATFLSMFTVQADALNLTRYSFLDGIRIQAVNRVFDLIEKLDSSRVPNEFVWLWLNWWSHSNDSYRILGVSHFFASEMKIVGETVLVGIEDFSFLTLKNLAHGFRINFCFLTLLYKYFSPRACCHTLFSGVAECVGDLDVFVVICFVSIRALQKLEDFLDSQTGNTFHQESKFYVRILNVILEAILVCVHKCVEWNYVKTSNEHSLSTTLYWVVRVVKAILKFSQFCSDKAVQLSIQSKMLSRDIPKLLFFSEKCMSEIFQVSKIHSLNLKFHGAVSHEIVRNATDKYAGCFMRIGIDGLETSPSSHSVPEISITDVEHCDDGFQAQTSSTEANDFGWGLFVLNE